MYLVISFHIPGKQNVLADGKSRKFNDHLEWKLDQGVFKNVYAIWQRPEIYVFASRLNYQIEKFCSWEPDPQSTFVNALTLKWSVYFYCVYVFPPFSILNCRIRKIKADKAKVILIAPYWLTQIWFPALIEILIENPRVISRKTNLLYN